MSDPREHSQAEEERFAAERFARHALSVSFPDLSADAVAQAKVFILDSFGVGIAGSTASGAAEILTAAKGWGSGDDARVWGRRDRMPAPLAAMINAFQGHCQEYDCVHEGAVLHPLTTLIPALTSHCERAGGISGRDFLTAVAVGVDVTAGLGIASRSAMRFFRPATAGGFGATAALGRLMELPEDRLARAFGLQYAQTSGTLQPHVEGSVALPLQVGFNSRAAVQACDLARAGVVGPLDVFEGPYGYLRLFEGEWDLDPVFDNLGKVWRVAELSHKPYPAGRATHAGVEGIIRLREEHGFTVEDVEAVTIVGPPVTARLCARPDMLEPKQNYAQLCMSYIAAKVLLRGEIDLAHYRGDELTDPLTHEVARKITMLSDGSDKPNALVPVDVTIRLKNGTELSWRCEQMLASPQRRLSRELHLKKFRRCWEFAADALTADARETLIAMVDDLETVRDMREVARLLAP
ncbi:MmgE/PrpD family protein [Bosea sp. CCNWLW174]|uniref:MmgE/PrpD family protein n=1 Tax=unclassified Bosea (in: a-proteobacteria) TaxID=2653178 RepID=UPI003014752B